MTPTEAIEKVKECGLNMEGQIYAECESVILSALEKQIPKKVMSYNNFERHCECGAIVKSHCKFCYECGQALDWSEEK